MTHIIWKYLFVKIITNFNIIIISLYTEINYYMINELLLKFKIQLLVFYVGFCK